MKVLETRVMRGPNIWSGNHKNLIVLKIDLEESEDFYTDKIDGFRDNLSELLPSLFSTDREDNFLTAFDRGICSARVIQHVALELQRVAGMDCRYGNTIPANMKGVYNIVFSYVVESAGLYAAEAACNIAKALENDLYYNIRPDIEKLQKINRQEGIGPSTHSIIDAAIKRGIPYRVVDSSIIFGQGCNKKIIEATVACTTSSISVDNASDKQKTKAILKAGHIPLAQGREIFDLQDVDEVINEIGFPLVIKPLDGNHGRGITTNIKTKEQACNAFEKAATISDSIIAEKFVEGNDYRFLVIDYKLVAVAKRTPAMITGNGVSTIRELIDKENQDPRRGDGHEKVLTAIKIDENTEKILRERNLTLDSVLSNHEILYLKDTANLSTGGTSEDVTDQVHSYNIFLAERIARLMNLDICGIDIVAKRVDLPLNENNGAVIEVNAGPGFRMHTSPSAGCSRDAGNAVLEMLYKNNSPSRIPLIAITGTNGKTTVTRLIAHMAKMAGHIVGYTTTDGIYIGDQLIYEGDCSGPESAKAVLDDPLINFAVLETARGGIIRSGLGFDKCSVGIITNISEDHLGLNGVDTVEDLVKVKSVVVKNVLNDGYAILNADNDLVYELKNELKSNVALFSSVSDNERIIQHCQNNGLAIFIDNGWLVLHKNRKYVKIIKIDEVPLTFRGTSDAMVENLLPAVLTGVINGFEIELIRESLFTFIPSPELTPGRMNVFKMSNFELMIDYAHNTDGFKQLKKFLQKKESACKIGVISAPGDRRDEDIIKVGRMAAEMFDEIIIRHDENTRDRSREQITCLLMQGIFSANKNLPVKIISEELDAMEYCLNTAKDNYFITVCTDKVRESIEFIKTHINVNSPKNDKQEINTEMERHSLTYKT